MFDFFRKHTRVLQFVLVLLIFPSFAFLGIQGYGRFSEGANDIVARVADQRITQAEWDAAHREQVARLQQQMPNVDAKIFDSPEVKRRTLDELVRERVLRAAATEFHLITTDERLQRQFAADPEFAMLRNVDGSINKDALAQQGMSSDIFAQRLRQEITKRQVLLGVGGTVLAPSSTANTSLNALLQQREIQVLRFDAQRYATEIKPSETELQKFYENPANSALFTAPEQADIEYVVLDLDAMTKGLSVSDDELRKYYSENTARYTTPEERRASHILIKADKNLSADSRQQAKNKAQSLLAAVRKNPAAFVELAKKNSEDPGSAAKGGDLDYFGRGAMVKPFGDAVFGLKEGEISPLVESDFGFHIIRLTAVRGGSTRSFDAVRAEVDAEVRRQLAQRRYTEAAVEFTNIAYEQPDSLKPLQDQLKLELQAAQGVRRAPIAGATGALASPKFLETLFGNDALRNKRNTEAIEVGANQMVSGRVLRYQASHVLPFSEVKPQVHAAVKARDAATLAKKQGLARLAILKQAPNSVLKEPLLTVSRAQTRELPSALINAVLRADATKLPGIVGVDLGEQGFAVAKIVRVLGRDPAAGDSAQATGQYAQAWGAAEVHAYYSALKSRFKVDVSAGMSTLAAEQEKAASASEL